MYRGLVYAALLTFLGCGRIGFDATAPGEELQQDWADHFPGTAGAFNHSHAVVIDGNGNSYITGHFTDSIDVAGSELSSAGEADVFVVALSATGAVLWARRYGGTGYDEALDAAIDAAGNLYVTGGIAGGVDFGGEVVGGFGGQDIWVASFTPNGDHRWSRAFGSDGNDVGRAIAVADDGAVVMAGVFRGGIDLGAHQLAGSGASNTVVAALTDTTSVWAVELLGTGGQERMGVDLDSAGNVAVTGEFSGDVDFGQGLRYATGTDVFVSSYDDQGRLRWSRQFGGPGNDKGFDVAFDSHDRPAITGRFEMEIELGSDRIIGSGGRDIFVAALDGAGDHRWSRGFATNGDDQGNRIQFAPTGSVYVAGEVEGTVDFGRGPQTSSGRDAFVVRFDAGGDGSWSEVFGGAGSDTVFGLAVAADGVLVVSGQIGGTANLAGDPLVATGEQDIYAVRFEPAPP